MNTLINLTHQQLIILSWIIGMANPTSALLVGPFLAWLLRRLGRTPTAQRRAGLTGWLVLGVAQAAFLAFGFGTGFLGFRYAQPFMIPISLLNFVAAYWLIPRVKPAQLEPLSEMSVRRAAQAAYQRWMSQAGLVALPWHTYVESRPREAQQWIESARAALTVVHPTEPTSDLVDPAPSEREPALRVATSAAVS